MAKNNNVVLLGYEDEPISERNKSLCDFTVNKIGGRPDFPPNSILTKPILCALCKLPSRLIVQIYAPLEHSLQYHRTFYLFACINPTCWNKSESWICLRAQTKQTEPAKQPEIESFGSNVKSASTFDWCSEADNWDDDLGIKDESLDLQNCNVTNDKETDEDEESSNSFEESLRVGLQNVLIDEQNANNAVAQGGAEARLPSPRATAEIEVDETTEVITVDTPTMPQSNLGALLFSGLDETDGIPSDAPFMSAFMSVYPEEENGASLSNIDNHVKELLLDYQLKDGEFLSIDHRNPNRRSKSGGDGDVQMATEEYEESRPLHGDKMSHHFINKIKSNPDQILRYQREGSPLLLYRLPRELTISRCKYCQGERVFEFQLVPVLLHKLRLTGDQACGNRLDFGTVLVYTCKNSCWDPQDASLREELVIVQKELL